MIIRIKKALLVSIAILSSFAMAKPLVITSTAIIADITQNLAGDNVEVQSLIKKDADPHDFAPSIKDVVNLKKADLFIVNGLGLESWADKLVSSSGYKGDIVTATDGITGIVADDDDDDEDDHDHAHEGHAHDHAHEGHEHNHSHAGGLDPHSWNSAKNGIIYTKNIEKALIKLSPENKEQIQNNAKSYIEKLENIDKKAKEEFAKIPKEKRKVISEHDAFGYFAKEYDITFLSPLGVSSSSETSAGSVAKLIQQIKDENVKYYFTEGQLQNKLTKQVANATGATYGGELYPETLTDEKGPASNYLDALEYNINTILKALKL